MIPAISVEELSSSRKSRCDGLLSLVMLGFASRAIEIVQWNIPACAEQMRDFIAMNT